jgi:LmbE family N-acetylglucosaminyl deacetylase
MSAFARSSAEVSVCTVFGGFPVPPYSHFAQGLHAESGLSGDIIGRRRAEDRRALSILGVTPIHLTFLDAIYRRSGGGWLYKTADSLYGYEPDAELDLLWSLVCRLLALIDSFQPCIVMTCSSIGGHVDHWLTLLATTRACAASGTRLMIWEDIPYGLDLAIPKRTNASGLAAVSPVDIDLKIRAVEAYVSQVRMLWRARDDWKGRLRQHMVDRARTHGVSELLWDGDSRIWV